MRRTEWRLAIAGGFVALLAFAVFFAVGRGGRDPAERRAVEAPGIEVDVEVPPVREPSVDGTVPGLKPRPEADEGGEPTVEVPSTEVPESVPDSVPDASPNPAPPDTGGQSTGD